MHLGGNRRWVPLITVELNPAVIALKRPKTLKFISTIADKTTKDYRRTGIRVELWRNNRGKFLWIFFIKRKESKFELGGIRVIQVQLNYRQRRFQINVTSNLSSFPGKNDSQSKIWSMKQNHPASRGPSIFLVKSGRGKSRRLAEVPSSSRLIYENWRASARRVQNGPLPTQKDGGFSSIWTHAFYSSCFH